MIAALSIVFTGLAESSDVLKAGEQQQVSRVLEEDAQLLSDTQLQQLLQGQPEETQAEILRINRDARPAALQIALSIPILAGILGLLTLFRMLKLPDPNPPAEPCWADPVTTLGGAVEGRRPSFPRGSRIHW